MSLDLYSNLIGDDGARANAAALPDTKLTSPDRGQCAIGDAIAIKAALLQSMLASLNLESN